MINLLPPQEKKEIREEERWRMILILGIFSLFFLISLALILLSLNIYFSSTKLQAPEELSSPQIQELEAQLALTNQKLSQLNSFYQNQISWVSFLEKIYNNLSEGIYLTNISLNLTQKAGQNLVVFLSGHSPTREALSQLKKNLDDSSQFSDVSFPPSVWIKPKDINFSVTFQLR